MSKARWFSVLVLAFGVMIIPWLGEFFVGLFLVYDSRNFYDLSKYTADERMELVIYIYTHWIYALLALVSAIAIFGGQSWAPRFWLTTCVVILVGVIIETIVFGYPWTEYWFQAVFTFTSLWAYRSDIAQGLLRHAGP